MTTDTTTPSYWLNWRFLICAIWILAAMTVSSLIIWKYEGFRSQQRENNEQKKAGAVFKDEVWKTCYQAIHPRWLLAYRLIAFALLLSLLVADVVLHGVHILYYYTQWTFILVTIFFGVGTSLSIRGCLRSHKGGSGGRADAERRTYGAQIPENASVLIVSNGLNSLGEPHVREAAGPWDFAFQIIFQVLLCLQIVFFWLVIYPFLTDKNYRLHFLAVCMHSVNAVCLLGDVFLNCLRFPFFRIAYFVLWTCMFVVFQWILHIFVSLRWPYPFLDLSSQYAPLWYSAVGILCLPCYGIFAILVRIKKCWLSRFASQFGYR